MNDREPSTEQQTTRAEIESGQSAGSMRDDHMLSCPVCGAQQSPADRCRRCCADLSLLIRFRSVLERRQTRCLALIRQRRHLRATQAAKECYELSADRRSLRLLVTCYLLQGDFASAMATLAKVGDRESEPNLSSGVYPILDES